MLSGDFYTLPASRPISLGCHGAVACTSLCILAEVLKVAGVQLCQQAAHALRCCTAQCLCWVAACRFILLEADATLTPWSKICVAQADCILLVGAEESSPRVRAAQHLRLLCHRWYSLGGTASTSYNSEHFACDSPQISIAGHSRSIRSVDSSKSCL